MLRWHDGGVSIGVGGSGSSVPCLFLRWRGRSGLLRHTRPPASFADSSRLRSGDSGFLSMDGYLLARGDSAAGESASWRGSWADRRNGAFVSRTRCTNHPAENHWRTKVADRWQGTGDPARTVHESSV